MGQQFLGEIRMFGFEFAPNGWAFCNGQILSIAQNTALFSILGTTYGGNGTSNFALPNFQGRMPVDSGPGFILGQLAGETGHTLTLSEYPQHNHAMMGEAGSRTSSTPGGGVLASGDIYGIGPPDVILAAEAVGLAGGGQAHENRQPYLAINFCIALVGIFPSRN
jgi:microcystin-dependent protein